MGATLTPEPARTEELGAAFRLLFQHLPPREQDRRVANALHLVQRGELDRAGILVLRGPDGLLGAFVCLPIPGASALAWPPAVVAGEHRLDREDRLLQHARAWLRSRGVKIAQALLAPDEVQLAPSLERNGFPHVTTLWYLRHDLHLPLRCLGVPSRLTFEPYDPANPSRFQGALLATYDSSLDCPEINGVRSIEEIIQGHQAQGLFDPTRWWLARAGDRPVGVLLTTEPPESRDWEVAYMGVVPQARRRGFGREILLQALAEARAAGASCLTLSVDARNRPAWGLYHSIGFQPYDRREVYLAVWRHSSQSEKIEDRG
jgi:ribosomal protein S18 acetylase RimI-like enzyme